MSAPRPLGYWIKTVDRLLDERFAQAAEAAGVGGREWQVLHRLAVGAVAEEALEEAFGPYVGEGERLAEPVDRVESQGLAERRSGELRLTPSGEERVQEIQDAAVQEVRDRVTDGLGDDEVDQLVATLERLARSLGWAPV